MQFTYVEDLNDGWVYSLLYHVCDEFDIFLKWFRWIPHVLVLDGPFDCVEKGPEVIFPGVGAEGPVFLEGSF